MEDHVEQAPAQGSGGGLRASRKQVTNHQREVLVIETTVFTLSLRRQYAGRMSETLARNFLRPEVHFKPSIELLPKTLLLVLSLSSEACRNTAHNVAASFYTFLTPT